MKIQGPNPYLQIYNQQKHVTMRKKNNQKTDHLNISEEAKMMQIQQAEQAARRKYIEELKEKVQTGKYEINYEELAGKIINHWNTSKK